MPTVAASKELADSIAQAALHRVETIGQQLGRVAKQLLARLIAKVCHLISHQAQCAICHIAVTAQHGLSIVRFIESLHGSKYKCCQKQIGWHQLYCQLCSRLKGGACSMSSMRMLQPQCKRPIGIVLIVFGRIERHQELLHCVISWSWS